MSEQPSSPVLVTGGTGTLGRQVVHALRACGTPVRVMSRRPRETGAVEDRAGPPVQWAVADLVEGTGIADAVRGVTAIVHCATTLGRADVRATQRLVRTAHTSGGRPHFVYISIVGVDRVPMFYYRAKLAAERVVQDCGLPWTILRTTQFHDLVADVFAAQHRLPVVLTLGGDARLQPIDSGEVAERLAALALVEPSGRAAEMGGPLVHDLRELASMSLRARGSSRPVLPLRLPGAAVRAVRSGGLLTEDRAVGAVDHETYLRRRYGS
ncbi:NAD(P)H-binding protein [Streptomyces sp. XM4193]|uniref:SDR family oxidoreductase n=1 Tax=Streptomyces sp. XM4193 TaxID=2929782 RepID=UPI001FFC17FF|nr:NAD(P)H-binding protein [Streptomyces sp. XM4193]MCK1798728.1 NAD(P)H-binding protein [Streptomyces sp. XM4193]